VQSWKWEKHNFGWSLVEGIVVVHTVWHFVVILHGVKSQILLFSMHIFCLLWSITSPLLIYISECHPDFFPAPAISLWCLSESSRQFLLPKLQACKYFVSVMTLLCAGSLCIVLVTTLCTHCTGTDFISICIFIMEPWISFHEPRFNLQHKQEIFSFSNMSRVALEPTQPHIEWGFFPSDKGVKAQICLRLWINGVIPPFLLCAFIAWKETCIHLWHSCLKVWLSIFLSFQHARAHTQNFYRLTPLSSGSYFHKPIIKLKW
jgi:hypothetical protein